ncbi:helix-hairpin-helix domain-containing protein [Loigolactobacillus bifermentans]|uniref:ComE operon protein 1 n=1 Tax=Loigolactobacillus bifermentans DSM 20003 TaxID=1423726 RepID=A0A0R1GJ25_9LACO|nr:helix-hairpin-helix domain-containing protein [Loigolactobacillus bifermentans]KRK34110.1 ComE operon protein 1 [Loigolactobacillus bifermentans DSM 20003]QGG59232.1 competence protein ComE [Loigolactobacillus bifermentans]
MKQYGQWCAIGLLSVLCVVLIGICLHQPAKKAPKAATDPFKTSMSAVPNGSSNRQTTQQQAAGFVDVKGAVKHPGIYQIQGNARLFDIIRQAGGFAEDADQRQINLAQSLTDQQVVYVPVKGEQGSVAVTMNSPESAVGSSTTTSENSSNPAKVSLNQATATELQALNGIGQKKAEQIIAYREENGGFKALEDLKEVSGIGDKTYEGLKDSITL